MSQNIQCATCTSLRIFGYKHEQVALNRAQVTQTKFVHGRSGLTKHGIQWLTVAARVAIRMHSRTGNSSGVGTGGATAPPRILK